jgi:hypothetical protein
MARAVSCPHMIVIVRGWANEGFLGHYLDGHTHPSCKKETESKEDWEEFYQGVAGSYDKIHDQKI